MAVFLTEQLLPHWHGCCLRVLLIAKIILLRNLSLWKLFVVSWRTNEPLCKGQFFFEDSGGTSKITEQNKQVKLLNGDFWTFWRWFLGFQPENYSLMLKFIMYSLWYPTIAIYKFNVQFFVMYFLENDYQLRKSDL